MFKFRKGRSKDLEEPKPFEIIAASYSGGYDEHLLMWKKVKKNHIFIIKTFSEKDGNVVHTQMLSFKDKDPNFYIAADGKNLDCIDGNKFKIHLNLESESVSNLFMFEIIKTVMIK